MYNCDSFSFFSLLIFFFYRSAVITWCSIISTFFLLCNGIFFASYEVVDRAPFMFIPAISPPARVYVINISEVKAVSHFFSKSKCLLLT